MPRYKTELSDAEIETLKQSIDRSFDGQRLIEKALDKADKVLDGYDRFMSPQAHFHPKFVGISLTEMLNKSLHDDPSLEASDGNDAVNQLTASMNSGAWEAEQ